MKGVRSGPSTNTSSDSSSLRLSLESLTPRYFLRQNRCEPKLIAPKTSYSSILFLRIIGSMFMRVNSKCAHQSRPRPCVERGALEPDGRYTRVGDLARRVSRSQCGRKTAATVGIETRCPSMWSLHATIRTLYSV